MEEHRNAQVAEALPGRVVFVLEPLLHLGKQRCGRSLFHRAPRQLAQKVGSVLVGGEQLHRCLASEEPAQRAQAHPDIGQVKTGPRLRRNRDGAQPSGPHELDDGLAFRLIDGFQAAQMIADRRHVQIHGEVHVRSAGDEGDRVQVQDQRVGARQARKLAPQDRAEIPCEVILDQRLGDERQDFPEVDVGEHAVGLPGRQPRRPLHRPVHSFSFFRLHQGEFKV